MCGVREGSNLIRLHWVRSGPSKVCSVLSPQKGDDPHQDSADRYLCPSLRIPSALPLVQLSVLMPVTPCWSFPSGSDGEESACSAGDPGLIPGSGRSPGAGHGNPLQYSGLGNPMDRGATYSPWGRKESDTTEQLTLSPPCLINIACEMCGSSNFLCV